MLSKNMKVTLLGLFVGLFVVNCSYFFDEKEKVNEVVYEEEVGGCMTQANNTMIQYFADQPEKVVSEEDLVHFSACYNDSLDSFITYTKSGRAESDDYSAENIELLIKKFHENKQLSADRIRGYLMLKAFVIGGSKDTISKDELKVLKMLLPMLGDALRKLLPYRQILLRSARLDKSSEDYQKFKEAFEIFEKDLVDFLRVVDRYQGNREINVVEVAQFLFSELYGDEAVRKANLIPLLVAFKNFAVDEEKETLNRQNLASFMTQAMLTHKATANFYYFLKDDTSNSLFRNIGNIVSFISKIPAQLDNAELFKGIALTSLEDILNTGETVLKKAIEPRDGGTLEMHKFREVLVGLEVAEIMKGELTAGTLSYFLSNFFANWIDPGNRVGSAVTQRKVADLKWLIDKWFTRQKKLNEIFENQDRQSVSLVRLNSTVPIRGEMDQWTRLLENVGVHQWDDNNRVQFKKDMGQFSYRELTVSNSIWLLGELFMRPYNRDESDVLKYKVTEAQTQEVYELVRVLGVELAFMDSRIVDSGERVFREMNSFSTQISSDGYMDFFEGYEYLSIASSSGNTADRLYEDIPVQCHRDSIDVHRRKVIEAECFRGHLKDHFLRYFGHLDAVANYWNSANNLRKDEFLGALEIASRAGVIREKPYDLAEIRVTVTILSYLQSIFFMFDREHRNGLADGIEDANGSSELRRAEAHFRPLVKYFILEKRPEVLTENAPLFKISCGDGLSDDEMLDCIGPKIFIHLLTKGSLPLEPTDTCGKAQFAWILIKANEDKAYRKAQATAADVMKVFSALAKITHKSHVGIVENFLSDPQQQQALFNSLSYDSAPDCRAQPDNVFCRWGRELYCNESVNSEVYNYFKDNKYNLFPQQRFSNDPKKSVEKTMLDIFSTFDEHQRFSTLCAFPYVEEGHWSDGAVDTARDCVIGDEEEPSLIDHGKQLLDDVGSTFGNWFGGGSD